MGDAAAAALEAIVGWRTNRKVRGKLVLGAIDGPWNDWDAVKEQCRALAAAVLNRA